MKRAEIPGIDVAELVAFARARNSAADYTRSSIAMFQAQRVLITRLGLKA